MRIDNPQLSGSIHLTGSTTIIGSTSITGSLSVLGLIEGQSQNAITASYALVAENSTNSTQAVSASYASFSVSSTTANTATSASIADTSVSASYALTASYALNAGGGAGAGFPFSGSGVITGSLFVSGGTVSGSFVGNGSGLTDITINQFATFEDTFTNVPSHSAVHNFGTKNVFVQVFEEDDTLIIPESVTTTNLNQVDIVFGDSISGRVVIGKAGHLLQDTGNFSASTTKVQTFTNALTASINHILDSENVITQVFDLNGNVIVPSNIKVQDTDNIKVTFATPRSGKVVIVKAGHIVQGTSENAVSASFSDVSKRVRAGSSGSRPTVEESGSLWYNTDTSTLEVYTGAAGSEWKTVGPNILTGPYEVNYLVVAGGGGGGASLAGGGGGGGFFPTYLGTALSLESGPEYRISF